MPGKSTTAIKSQIEKGISILKRGGLVAFPTDTVYGLGACATLPKAVEKVYKVKNRPKTMALPVLVANESQISKFAERVPPVAWLLIRRFMPGALTIVLPKSSLIPDIVTAGGTTVAIRIPAHPVPIALIEGLGTPVIGTSANLSGKPSPLTAEGVYAQLGDNVGLIIDGGRCSGGKESTVVDVTGEAPIIMREGAISKKEIEEILRSKE
ncbi:MAG: L-threonylcarbamoyladenylate synthase [Chloroflexota bacterium]